MDVSSGQIEMDDVRTFCAAMRISRTSFYVDLGRGLICVVKRGSRTLIPKSERAAYLRRLAEQSASKAA